MQLINNEYLENINIKTQNKYFRKKNILFGYYVLEQNIKKNLIETTVE